MDQNLVKNIKNRVDILKQELIDELDNNIDRIKNEHAAKGLLRSGASIKRVMKEINNLVDKYYSDILQHIKSLPLVYSPSLEAQLKEKVDDGLSAIISMANERLSAITSFVQKPILYKQVLQDVEEENNKFRKRFENNLNTFCIDLSKSNEPNSKPWEEEVLKLWRFATKGKRKVLTFPIVAVFILIPAIAGLTDSYSRIWSTISATISQEKSVPLKSESDVFNEWIIAIGHAKNESAAKELKTEFIKAYLASGHVNYKNEPIWINDIFHVRHPTEKGIWLVVIDAFPGESTEEQVRNGLNEMAQLAFSSRELSNTLGHYLYGSRVFHYKKSDFINTYGEIIGQ